MCYHKLYTFLTCGHSVWGALLRACPSFAYVLTKLLGQGALSERGLRRLTRHIRISRACEDRKHHPYQTIKFNSTCGICVRKKKKLQESREYGGAKDNLLDPAYKSGYLEDKKIDDVTEMGLEDREELIRVAENTSDMSRKRSRGHLAAEPARMADQAPLAKLRAPSPTRSERINYLRDFAARQEWNGDVPP